jgi:hypothetical protein
MSSNKYADFRKVVYYYWSDVMTNNNKDTKRKFYRALNVETVYLDDKSLKYRNNIINYFKKEVLCIIDELKYMPPVKIGKFYFNGGYLYHEAKHSFDKKCY